MYTHTSKTTKSQCFPLLLWTEVQPVHTPVRTQTYGPALIQSNFSILSVFCLVYNNYQFTAIFMKKISTKTSRRAFYHWNETLSIPDKLRKSNQSFPYSYKSSTMKTGNRLTVIVEGILKSLNRIRYFSFHAFIHFLNSYIIFLFPKMEKAFYQTSNYDDHCAFSSYIIKRIKLSQQSIPIINLLRNLIRSKARSYLQCFSLIFLLTGLRIYTGEYKAQGPT